MIANKGKVYAKKGAEREHRTADLEADENQSFHVKHDAAPQRGAAPRERKQQQQLVCGMRPVMEALDAGLQIDKILIQSNLEGALAQELRAKIRQAGLPIQYVPAEKLNRMTSANHQGVVATISPVRYQDFTTLAERLMGEGRSPLLLMLDHITDVRNLGAIARTAECAGIDALVLPDRGSAQLNEEAIKTSSGALLRLPLCRESNFKTTLLLARQLGIQVCAATEKGATDYREVDFSRPTLLVMGAEDRGVSPEVLKLSDVRAKLPIRGEVQSLNVSVAAAIFMYEALRQRDARAAD